MTVQKVGCPCTSQTLFGRLQAASSGLLLGTGALGVELQRSTHERDLGETIVMYI